MASFNCQLFCNVPRWFDFVDVSQIIKFLQMFFIFFSFCWCILSLRIVRSFVVMQKHLTSSPFLLKMSPFATRRVAMFKNRIKIFFVSFLFHSTTLFFLFFLFLCWFNNPLLFQTRPRRVMAEIFHSLFCLCIHVNQYVDC